MGRLETVASLNMVSSDCVSCVCLLSINKVPRSSDSDVAEGCGKGEIECGVPVHNAQHTKTECCNSKQQATNPRPGRLVIRERCSKRLDSFSSSASDQGQAKSKVAKLTWCRILHLASAPRQTRAPRAKQV